MNAHDVARTEPILPGLVWDSFGAVMHRQRKVAPGGFTRWVVPVFLARRANRSFYGTGVGIPGCP
jgi:hypothetical protein